MVASETEALIEVVYVSKSGENLPQGEILKLISLARQWNESHGITGVLFYRKGNFAQILEGSFTNMHLVCGRIKRDKRHHTIVQIESIPISFRRYPDQALRFFGDVGLEMHFPHLANALIKGESDPKKLLELIKNPA